MTYGRLIGPWAASWPRNRQSGLWAWRGGHVEEIDEPTF